MGEEKKEKLLADSIIIGVDFSKGADGKDNQILIVGRKTIGRAVDIINAFQGEEAVELYNRLVTKKENVNTVEGDK